MPLPSLIEFFQLQFMQQYVNGFLPKPFNELWITNSARIERLNHGQPRFILRNSDDLYLPFCRLASLSKHPLFMFPKTWSEFNHPEIKILREKTHFNSKLKEYFINNLKNNYICGRLLCPHCHL